MAGRGDDIVTAIGEGGTTRGPRPPPCRCKRHWHSPRPSKNSRILEFYPRFLFSLTESQTRYPSVPGPVPLSQEHLLLRFTTPSATLLSIVYKDLDLLCCVHADKKKIAHDEKIPPRARRHLAGFMESPPALLLALRGHGR